MFVDPVKVFQGVIVVNAPHMDDDVLACGGTLALLPEKERIHVIYATDGLRSPAPVLPSRNSVSSDLGLVRIREAREALKVLGIPDENVHFLGLPDGRLNECRRELGHALVQLITQIKPDHVFAPFRYDRHPDHLALNQVVTVTRHRGDWRGELSEYFVYHRWRLLPQGDIRKYIRPEHLMKIDITDRSWQKRAALARFQSQTTKFYTWQERPILTKSLLDETSRQPEYFLRYDSSFPETAIFSRAVPWIRLVHKIEPLMKKKKDQAIALWYSQFRI